MNLNEAKTNFIQHLKALDRSPSTITAYSKDIEQLCKYLEDQKTNDIKTVTTEILSRYIEHLKTDNKNSYTLKTISRKINSMKTFFKYLYGQGILESEPAQAVKHPKYTIAPPRILTKLEYRALRDVARTNPRLYTIVELLLQTGARIGEIARLTIEDINLEKNPKTIIIRKYASNGEREVELNEPAVVALKTYLSSRPTTNDGVEALFVTKNGNRLLVRNIRTSISRAFEKAGIEKATVNDIRNTFIITQLKAGMSVELVGHIAGHKRLTSTKKYLKLVDTRSKRKISKITPL